MNTCPTCNHPADSRYKNEAAGEVCTDSTHDGYYLTAAGDRPRTNTVALRALTARSLIELIRAGGPSEMIDAARDELATRRRGAGWLNHERNAMYARAEYYAWAARRNFPAVANDPIGGRPWDKTPGPLAREIGRAENLAAARVCYRRARAYPCPLP